MATKRARPKDTFYGEIERGTSLTIPVRMIDREERPLDLTGLSVSFTAKRLKYDFDAKDERAYIRKDFEPQEPTKGQFFIRLTSKDTDFEPGSFYFDIQITTPAGAVYRLATLTFDLVGGPTNRNVSPEIGQLPIGDEITIITAAELGKPIVVITSLIADDLTSAQLARTWDSLVEILNTLESIKTTVGDLQVLVDQLQQTDGALLTAVGENSSVILNLQTMMQQLRGRIEALEEKG